MASAILRGIRVLELGDYVSAAFGARLLGDYGAEVIKIEAPGAGDMARRHGPFPQSGPDPDASGLFMFLNRGKLSATLDLTKATGRDVARDLVRTCDVVIHNYLPQELDALGLDYGALRAINPGVVLTSVTVFGHEGPYSGHKAYALNGSCAGGAAHRIGDPDRYPLAMPYSRADLWGGLNSAPAVMLALLARRRDGPGQHVDIAAADAMNDFGNGGDMIAYAADGYETRRHGMHTPISYPYSVLPCKDGHVSMILGNEHHWQRLLDIMGRPEWTKDPRFQNRSEIGALHAKEVDEHLKEFIAGFTKDEFWKMCRDNSLPWHAAQTIEDVLAWDLLEGRGFWREAEDGGGRRWRLPGPLFAAAGLDGDGPDAPAVRAPRLGEHNDYVLGGLLGLSEDQVAHLGRAGVV